MVNFRSKRVGGPLAVFVALVVAAAMALTAGTASGSSGTAAQAAASRTVGQTAQGELRSHIAGQTGSGSRKA